MDFDEWWEQNRSSIRPAKAEDAFRSVWDAAVAAEREACAKVCETHTVDDVLVGVGIAKSCAAMIRARSNPQKGASGD